MSKTYGPPRLTCPFNAPDFSQPMTSGYFVDPNPGCSWYRTGGSWPELLQGLVTHLRADHGREEELLRNLLVVTAQYATNHEE